MMRWFAVAMVLLLASPALAQVKGECSRQATTVELCRYTDGGVTFYGLSGFQAPVACPVCPPVTVATCETIGPCTSGTHCEAGPGGAVCVADAPPATLTCAALTCPPGFRCSASPAALACIIDPCPNAWEVRNATGACVAVPCPEGQTRNAAGVCEVPPPPPGPMAGIGESHDNVAPVADCTLPFQPGASSWAEGPAPSWAPASGTFTAEHEAAIRAEQTALATENVQPGYPPRQCGHAATAGNQAVLEQPATWMPELDRHVAYELRLRGLCAGAMGDTREQVYVKRSDGLYEAWVIFDSAGCLSSAPMAGVFRRLS